jgi:hypothetical protein
MGFKTGRDDQFLRPGSSGPFRPVNFGAGGDQFLTPGSIQSPKPVGEGGFMPESYGNVPEMSGVGGGMSFNEALGMGQMAMGLGDVIRGPRQRPPGSGGYGGRGGFSMPTGVHEHLMGRRRY